jgi:hypothetical protein
VTGHDDDDLDLVDLLASGLGFHRADTFDVEESRERNAALVAALTPPLQRRPRKPRTPTLADALRDAARAKRSVRGAAVYADRVEITFGDPVGEAAEPDEVEAWIKKQAAHAD